MKNEIIEQILKELSTSKSFVEKSFPSVYTKQDVFHLLDEFADRVSTYVFENVEEKKTSRFMSLEGVEELEQLLIKALYKGIERLDSEEVVDYSSACFNIAYNNTIEIENIDYLSDNITEVVDVAVAETLRDFFTAEEEEVSVQEPQQ